MENIAENNIDELCPAIEGEVDVPETIFTSEAESYLTGDIITPQMFGAKADGVTDDSKAIRAAIAELDKRKTGTLYFPPGVYIHGNGEAGEDGTGKSYEHTTNADGELYRPNVGQVKSGNSTRYVAFVGDEIINVSDYGRDIRFYFEGYTNLNILGYGAEIRSHDGNGQNRNNAMFMFENCAGVTIKGLKLDGRRQERGVDQDDYIPGPITEFLQCNITFAYTDGIESSKLGCRDILIEDVTCVNSVHDGISIGWGVDNVKIINCVCDNAQRNGIAICGCKNVVIEGCECNDNGVSGDGYRGILPLCGIDIEAHPTGANGTIEYPNVNVHVTNCTIERNVRSGFSIYREGHNISIEKCYIKDNPHLSLTDDGEITDTYIRNCTIINSRLYSGFTLIENNTIEQHYKPQTYSGEIIYTNGYSFDDQDTDDNPEAPHTCRNNVFKFIVDKESSLQADAYMGIRLRNNREFVGNKVIGAFSIGSFYPVMLQNKACKDNVFNRGFNTINGIDVTKEPMGRIYYSEVYDNGNYRENNDFGDYYIYGSKDMHKEAVTDTTFKKSYSFNGDLADHYYRIPRNGATKITVSFLGQEEEIVYAYDALRVQHILKRESTNGDFLDFFKDKDGSITKETKLVTVYIQFPYIYLKSNVPYPMFTVSREMEYYYNWYSESFFSEEVMTDVTEDVKSGVISLPTNAAIDMIRQCGDNTRRPHYGNISIGTIYFDTYLEKDIWWDGKNWFDKEGNQITKRGDKNEVLPIHAVFTIDGKKYYRNDGDEFKDWIKSKFNTLRLREADVPNGNGNRIIVSADGNKTLYIKKDGQDTEIYGNYAVTELMYGGEYFFKETPNANPNYSNVPVFWNGTELVTTPIYNGEVE